MENVSLIPVPAVKSSRPLYSHVVQTIRFSGLDEDNSVEVVSDDVTIIPSSGDHQSGSSKVKLQNIVDFNWELRFYTGELLAVHMAGKYVAYGISVGKGNGLVRVVNRVNNERSLLKGMQGMVQDIAFAHIPQEVLLACVDEFGNLLVHSVQETDNKMICSLFLHVQHRIEEIMKGINHRVIWCPFIPDEEEPSADSPYDDVAKLLVLAHGCQAELWNVGVVAARHGCGPLFAEDVEEGFLQVHEHSKPIVDAAFSPDGVALATASLDGDVKFFQVYMHTGEKPRCLHHWQPHGGKPVTALFFLDNHQSYNPEVQFWKYAITGAENNTELKLWSCESWSCLQTIRFAPENSQKKVVLKAGLDMGAGYLLLSDIYNKLLYVLQILNSNGDNCAYIRSVTEFSLPYPILSFGIVDAGLRTVKTSSFEDLCIEDGGGGEDEPQQSVQAVVVRMYLVQPKSLQECHITFQVPTSASGQDLEKMGSLSSDSLMFKDGFSDLSRSLLDKSDLDTSVQEVSANHTSQLNLMTPDAFSSPRKESPGELSSPRVSLHKDSSPLVPKVLESPLAASLGSSREDTIKIAPHSDNEPLATSEPIGAVLTREGFASAGSSPSREVQQILSLSSEYLPDNIEVMDQVELPAKASTPKDQFGTVNKDKVDGDGWPQIPLSLVDVHKSISTGDGNSTKRNVAGAENDAGKGNAQQVKQSLTNLAEQISAIGELQSKHTSAIEDLQRQFADYQQQCQTQMKEIQVEMKVQNAANQEKPSGSANAPLVAHLEQLMTQQQAAMHAQLCDFAKTVDERERRNREDYLSVMNQIVLNTISTKLNEIVVSEFKNHVAPALCDSMEPLKRQVQMELAQKFSLADTVLKENLAKLIESKSVVDTYTFAMSGVLQPLVKSCFKEVFQSVLLPSFERAFRVMFQQINDAFNKGMKEYLQIVDSHFEKQHRHQEKNRDLLNQIQVLSENLRTHSDSLALQLCQEVQRQMHSHLMSIQENVTRTVADTVKEHISKGFHAQKSVIEDSVITAVRSRAVTPAPHMLDAQLQQAQILQLITQGQINAAFQQALSASDLNLVVFVCEKVNPAQVFNQSPCPLQQHVLLSLIQQLSSDLANHTELKHKYLEEAVMNLDPTNLTTREHLPGILNNLQRQMIAYMQSNPNNKMTRSMRILHMAIQSLLRGDR